MSLQLDKGGGYQTYRVIEIKDSLSKFALKLRDKYGTHLDKFVKKLWDRSRGHLAASLINRPCVYLKKIRAMGRDECCGFFYMTGVVLCQC